MTSARPALFLILSVLTGVILAQTYLIWELYQRQPLATEKQRDSYSAAYERAALSVVSIYSVSTIKPAEGLWDDPLFSQYRERLKTPPATLPRIGSGVILDQSGHILTNYHVVKMSQQIQVEQSDGRRTDVELIAADPETDLAVLKLDSEALVPIEAATKPVRQGDIVLALGNAYGVGQAVTQGVVSGLGRNNLGLSSVEDYIQTDVAINPGSSGGALVNTSGELVGIVTALFTTDGSYQGISFAIPAAAAIEVARLLIDDGKIVRGYLGVEMHPLSAGEADFFGLANTNGMLITGVRPQSPADEAGIRPGDVLMKINDEKVTSAQQSKSFVAGMKPGSSVQLDLFRRGKIIQVEANISPRPATGDTGLTDLN